ncbi:hypothetical protein STEG23_029976 [Scotinomys teguina]
MAAAAAAYTTRTSLASRGHHALLHSGIKRQRRTAAPYSLSHHALYPSPPCQDALNTLPLPAKQIFHPLRHLCWIPQSQQRENSRKVNRVLCRPPINYVYQGTRHTYDAMQT